MASWYTANGTSWTINQSATTWDSTTTQWNSLSVSWNDSDSSAWNTANTTSFKTDNSTGWNNNNIFVDDFVTDGWLADNGKGWTDAGVVLPNDFSRIKTLNGSAYVQPDATIPSNCDLGVIAANGGFYSITCAYQDTGLEDIEITTVWRGDTNLPAHTSETAPLACITESSSKFGFGIWTSTLFNLGFGLIGWIGKPGTLFAISHYISYTRTDQPRTIKMTVKDYRCRFYIDGIEYQTYTTPGNVAEDVYIPAELRGSTKHGFALDQHLGVSETTNCNLVKITPYNYGESMNMATSSWYNQNS